MHHQTIIIGNIGRDPEVKTLPSGMAVAEFGVAVNERFKRQDGSKGEHTEWYNCRCYGKLAELVAEYRRKGDLVFCQGRQHTDKWEKDGASKSRVYLNIDTMRGLSGFQGKQKPDSKQETPPAAAGTQGADDFDDDIPF